MNETNHTNDTQGGTLGPVTPSVDVAAAQAKAAEAVAQIVRNMIAEGYPPEPDSPLWQYVKRAA